jgi:hypothetical protein
VIQKALLSAQQSLDGEWAKARAVPAAKLGH